MPYSNPEKRKIHDKIYREKNKEKLREYRKKNSIKWKEKKRETYLIWYAKNKEIYQIKQKNSYLKRKYGISTEEKTILCEKANWQCMICEKKLISLKQAYVDHCHKTGKIRGILCSNCNLGIGNLKDSIKNLKNAIKYLKN